MAPRTSTVTRQSLRRKEYRSRRKGQIYQSMNSCHVSKPDLAGVIFYTQRP
jgi:hypothetical protein